MTFLYCAYALLEHPEAWEEFKKVKELLASARIVDGFVRAKSTRNDKTKCQHLVDELVMEMG